MVSLFERDEFRLTCSEISASTMSVFGEATGLLKSTAITRPRGALRSVWNQKTGPSFSIEKALKRAGMKASDIDLFECNEAFAAVVLRFMEALDIDHDKVNVNGGAIALGHPLGASGVRILGSLAHELRRRGGGYGVAALCIGVGQGLATIVEAV